MKKKSDKVNMTWVPLESLNPAPYNPRDITDRAFEGLKESIKKFGFVDPIIVNKRTSNIVGGHQRLKAAQSLELKEVPVVEIDVSEIEEKALNVTLNNQAISGFYTETLQDLLVEIRGEFEPEMVSSLHLDDLVISSDWFGGSKDIDDVEENLDGISSKITIRCPQEIKSDVIQYLKDKIAESDFKDVEIG